MSRPPRASRVAVSPRRWLPWLAGTLVVFGPGAVAQVQAAWWEYRLNRHVRELQAVHEDLAQERDRMQSDPVYVEGLIRTMFKVANPDELVVILDDGTDVSPRRVAGR